MADGKVLSPVILGSINSLQSDTTYLDSAAADLSLFLAGFPETFFSALDIEALPSALSAGFYQYTGNGVLSNICKIGNSDSIADTTVIWVHGSLTIDPNSSLWSEPNDVLYLIVDGLFNATLLTIQKGIVFTQANVSVKEVIGDLAIFTSGTLRIEGDENAFDAVRFGGPLSTTALINNCGVGNIGECDGLCNGGFDELLPSQVLANGQSGYNTKVYAWANGNTGTADVFYVTGNAVPGNFAYTYSQPLNRHGNQDPFDGIAYSGIALYHRQGTTGVSAGVREYIQTRPNLPCQAPANANQKRRYYVQMRMSLAERSEWTVNRIGMYFSEKRPVQWTSASNVVDRKLLVNASSLSRITPQITFDEEANFSDRTNWTELSQVLELTGKEKFLTIGNFYTDTETNNAAITPPQSVNGQFTAQSNYWLSYIYVDGVSVVPLPHLCAPKVNFCCQQTQAITLGEAYNCIDLDPARFEYLWTNLDAPSGDPDGGIVDRTSLVTTAIPYCNLSSTRYQLTIRFQDDVENDHWITYSETVTYNNGTPADFTLSANPLCTNSELMLTLTKPSTNLSQYGFQWTHSGANSAYQTGSNPLPIAYSTQGTYPIRLSVWKLSNPSCTTLIEKIVQVLDPEKPEVIPYCGESEKDRMIVTIAGSTNKPYTFENISNGGFTQVGDSPYYQIFDRTPSGVVTSVADGVYSVKCSTSAGCGLAESRFIVIGNRTLDNLWYYSIPDVPIISGFNTMGLNTFAFASINLAANFRLLGPQGSPVTMYMRGRGNLNLTDPGGKVTGSEIHVQEPGNFIIDNAKIKSECDWMWRGISVHHKAGLAVQNGSDLADAYQAITLLDGEADLTVVNSTFHNNYRSIFKNPRVDWVPPQILIAGSFFTSWPDDMKKPFDPVSNLSFGWRYYTQYHLFLDEIRANVSNNLFNNCQIAIWTVNNASLQPCSSNVFSNSRIAGIWGQSEGSTIVDNTFLPETDELMVNDQQRYWMLNDHNELNRPDLNTRLIGFFGTSSDYEQFSGNHFIGNNETNPTTPYDENLNQGITDVGAYFENCGPGFVYHDNTHEGLSRGVQFYVSGTSNTNTVSSSTFTNCGVSILVDGDAAASPPLPTDFRMHCNHFAPPETGIVNNQYGLVAGLGVSLGKVGIFEGTSLKPGTNWFPTDPTVDRTTLPFSGDVQDWAAPSGWVSLYGEHFFEYFRYLNEFANPLDGNADLENSGLNVVNYGNTPPSGAVAATCPISDNWPVIFPTRPALVSNNDSAIEEADLSLFPNPSKSFFFIRNHEYLKNQAFTISDMHGRLLMEGVVNGKGPINIRTLPEGLYQVRIFDSQGQASVHKLFVAN